MMECSRCDVLDDQQKLFCDKCESICHAECLKNGRPSPIEGDVFFSLTCVQCSESGEDILTRMKLPWVTVVHLALYNLQLQGNGKCGYFKWKDSICTYIDRHWHNFFPSDKKKSATWHGTIAGTLSNGSPQYFTSGSSLLGESGWWKLTENKPPPLEQLQPSSKLGRGKAAYREITTLNVLSESGRSSRSRVSSIQAAMELKARRDNTMEAKDIKRQRASGSKKVSHGPNQKSCRKTTPEKKESQKSKEIHSPNLVSILLPLPFDKSEQDVSDEKTIVKEEPEATPSTPINNTSKIYSASVSALLGDKESDSEIEIDPCEIELDPCALSNDDLPCERENVNIAENHDSNSQQEWEEIMAPFCTSEEHVTSKGKSITVKEDPVLSSEENEKYGTYSSSAFSDVSLHATEDLENSLSHSLTESSCNIKKELDLDSRPPSSLGTYASESEREESVSCDVSQHQSEADYGSETEGTEELARLHSSHVQHLNKIKRTRRRRKVQNVSQEPEVKKLKCTAMSIYEEKQLLMKMQTHENIISEIPEAARFRRKLLLREIKRQRGLPCFDLDGMMNKSLSQLQQFGSLSTKKSQESCTVNQPSSFNQTSMNSSMTQFADIKHGPKVNILDRYQTHHKIRHHSSGASFLNKLVGTDDDQLQCIRSPYTARLLKPFIRRDYETRPAKIKLLMEIQAYPHRNDPTWKAPDPPPIDYCYVQPHHIPSVNALCREFFWPGIDLSECLEYPDFSCVVLYRKFVIGFAFMVPDVNHHEAYISFLFTHPEWRGSGIAKFMVYHLIQTCMGKDITLHVSANNPAMLLYQKFGFKPEEFILDFYEKYFPSESKESRHAFYLRLRR